MNTPFEEKVTLRLESMSSQLESINKSIGQLATKNELNTAVSKLATKNEMNKAIDDLAGAVKKGFDEVHEKFVMVDEKFAKVDQRFDVLERKVERMNDSFSNQLDYFHLYYPTRNEFTDLDGRIKKVEKRLRLKI